MLFPLLRNALPCQKQHIIRHNDNKVKHGANEVIAIGAIIDLIESERYSQWFCHGVSARSRCFKQEDIMK